MKKFTIIFFSVIILTSGILSYLYLYGFKSSTKNIKINNIFVEETIIISGDLVNPSVVFSGFYGQKVIDNKLFIRPRYCFILPFNKSNIFALEVNVDGNTIDEIYIEGKEETDRELIWKR